MRELKRPPVPCGSCGANIYFNRLGAPEPDPNEVISKGVEPPDVRDKCPRCHADVDTTVAYAAIPGFPPSLAGLKAAYAGFVPRWEHARDSFEIQVGELLAEGNTPADIATELTNSFEWYKQRLFYRSCTAFYRCLQLFFGYLSLERHCFTTWAVVTGYYSRFFFIQAFVNLILANFDAEQKHVFFYNGKEVRCVEKKQLSPTLKKATSHEAWWQLMEAIKIPKDFDFEHTEFVLSRLGHSPQYRNTVNYGFEYLQGGFIELEWFDSGARQLLSHFNPHPRPDQDVTDMDRFFGDQDPESVDVGDFYGDDAQILWCSIKTYLDALVALGFQQNFVLVENIAALAEVHIGKDYPKLTRGILQVSEERLKQGFDVEKFMANRAAP